MQVIKCELCGSGDLIKKNDLYVCQHCGTKYTVEEARKLLGTVKIDKTDVKENNRTLARRAIQNKDYTIAKRYYDTLLTEEPNNWEAYFFCTLCRTLENNDPEQEENYAGLLNRIIPSTVQLIYQYVEDPKQQNNALLVVCNTLDEYINDSTQFSYGYYRENHKIEMLPKKWIHNKTAAYGSLYDTYLQSLYQYFPKAYPIISQVNAYYQEYVKNNRRAISWKQKREVEKNSDCY